MANQLINDTKNANITQQRIIPTDVKINIAKTAPVPKAIYPLNGYCWNDVVHENSLTWLAYYKDTIQDQIKYMYLSAQSKFKGLNDFLKYEKARRLKVLKLDI